MKLRSLIHQNQKATGIIAGAVSLICLFCITSYLFGSNDSDQPAKLRSTWFYDLNNKALFPAPFDAVAPIHVDGQAATEKPNGVKAYVFACGDCGNEDQRFIGWLEAFALESRQLMTANRLLTLEEQQVTESGRLVRSASGSEWAVTASEAGQQLMRHAQKGKCSAGTRIRRCHP